MDAHGPSLVRDPYPSLIIYSCVWLTSKLFRVTDELRSSKNIDLPQYSQPLSTAIQIALLELLASFGIVPKAVVGHSSGEIAAA